MQEYILYSQIPASRLDQVLHILAGVTASQPVNISEQCLIYQQLKSADNFFAKKGQVKQPQQSQRLYHHKLVRDIEGANTDGSWRLRMEEAPDAGVKNVCTLPRDLY